MGHPSALHAAGGSRLCQSAAGPEVPLGAAASAERVGDVRWIVVVTEPHDLAAADGEDHHPVMLVRQSGCQDGAAVAALDHDAVACGGECQVLEWPWAAPPR